MVVYLVSPNIPKKKFFYRVYVVSLVLWSYDNTIKLKLNSFLYLDYSSRYTAPTGIKQKVKQIMVNVFCSTFLNVF